MHAWYCNGSLQARTQKMRSVLRKRFDVGKFNAARKQLDPKGILSNQLMDTLFDE